MCPTKTHCKPFVDTNSPKMSTCLLLLILLNKQLKFFQILLCSWTSRVLLPWFQIVRNHFSVLLPKKQQNDMVQGSN